MDFYLDGIQVYPDNARNFTVAFEADPLQDIATISESFLEFSKTRDNDGFEIINNAILAGNYAIAIPVTISENGQTYFEGYADLSSVENQLSCDFFSIKLVEERVNTIEILNALSFDYMEFKGLITKDDYVVVPVSIETVPDLEKSAILSLTIYQVTSDLLDSTNPVTAPQLLLKIPLMAKLLNGVVESTIPFERYWYGMKVRRIFEIIADYLGLTFESNTLDKNYVVLPPKDKKPVTDIDNAIDKGYEFLSVGDWVKRMEVYFNARLQVDGNVLRFERIDYYYSNDSGVVLPELLPEQGINRTNLQELNQFRTLEYARDPNDNHTNNSVIGYICQSYTEIPTQSPDRLVLKGTECIKLDYTRGHRKNELSEVELALSTVLNPLFSQIESIASLAGVDVDLPTIPENTGALKISGESTSVAKMLICDSDGRISITNEEDLKAINIYRNFHEVSSMVNNQWLIYDEIKIPINNFTDVIALKNNNYVRDANGNICLVESNSRDENCMHTLLYRAKIDYLSGLNEIIREE